MSGTNDTTAACPTQEVWHDFLDDNGQGDLGWSPDTLKHHLDACPACAELVGELRRFRTLLLRSRVPGLDAAQWRELDERVQLMGSEFVPPQSRFGPMAWSLVAATVVALVGVTAWQIAGPAAMGRGEADGGPRVAIAGLQVGAVDGRVEVTDAAGAWHALKAGMRLDAGAGLRAEGEGRLTVPGHFELSLAEGTEIEVEEADQGATFLRLRHGEMGCQVEKRRPGQRFAVMAGRFRAEVVGTRFVVMHRPGGTVEVLVSEGAVRVDQAEHPHSAVGETTSVVRAGSRWRHAAGRMELGPMTPAPEAIELRTRAAEQVPVPKPRQANAETQRTRKAAPAGPRATTPADRNIIIHIPPQRMPREEVERLKAMERLLWGESARGQKDRGPRAHEGETTRGQEDGSTSGVEPASKAAPEPPPPPPVAGRQEPASKPPADPPDAVPPPPPLPEKQPRPGL